MINGTENVLNNDRQDTSDSQKENKENINSKIWQEINSSGVNVENVFKYK